MYNGNVTHRLIALVMLSLALAACSEGGQVVAVVMDGAPPALESGADATDPGGPPALDPGPCAASQWCWAYPQPTGSYLHDVWAASSTDVYAVGDAGTLLHYDGSSWQALYAGRGQDQSRRFYAVWGSGPSDVWAAMGEGTLLHFDGSRWWRPATGVTGTLTSLWGLGPSDVFAAGQFVHHFDGERWTKQATDEGVEMLEAGFSLAPQEAYAVGREGLVARFDGTQWRKMTTPDDTARLLSIWGSSSSQIYAGGASGMLWHFDGNAWTEGARRNNAVGAIWGRSASEIYFGQNDGVYRFDGNAFTEIYPQAPISGLADDGAGGLFAVGQGGTILHGGASGLSKMHGHSSSIDAIWGRSASEIYVAGYQQIWRLDDGALTPLFSFNFSAKAMCGQEPDVLHVLTLSELYTSRGGGAASRSSLPARVDDLWCGPNDVFAVGDSTTTADATQGGVFHFDGTSWTTVCDDVGDSLNSVWGSSATHVYAISHFFGSMVHYDGTSCQPVMLDTIEPLADIWGTSATNIFVLGEWGEVFRFDGTAWSKEIIPSIPHMEAIHGEETPVAVGHFGEIYRRVDGRWIEDLTPTSSTLGDVWAGDGVMAATGFTGILIRR